MSLVRSSLIGVWKGGLFAFVTNAFGAELKGVGLEVKGVISSNTIYRNKADIGIYKTDLKANEFKNTGAVFESGFYKSIAKMLKVVC